MTFVSLLVCFNLVNWSNGTFVRKFPVHYTLEDFREKMDLTSNHIK